MGLRSASRVSVRTVWCYFRLKYHVYILAHTLMYIFCTVWACEDTCNACGEFMVEKSPMFEINIYCLLTPGDGYHCNVRYTIYSCKLEVITAERVYT